LAAIGWPLAIMGGLVAAWTVDRVAAANARSAAGNISMAETITANWLSDLNGRGAAYKPALFAAEDRYRIPRYLLCRLAWQESRYRRDIAVGEKVSTAGALGLMQIVPRWHPDMSIEDCLNPPVAIDYAARYLSGLYGRFGTWELALKAYNWGPGNVAAWIKKGRVGEPRETALYSRQILADVRQIDGAGNLA